METLTNQYFNYRETPVEYDGTGTITDIKGNTVVFNQLVQNGNFANSDGWTANGGTLTIANNKAVISSATGTNTALRPSSFNVINGHKMLVMFDITSTVATTYTRPRFYRSGVIDVFGDAIALSANVKTRYASIVNINADCPNAILYLYIDQSVSYTGEATYENVNMIDLTQAYLDTLSVAQFRSLYPLNYYAYNSGELLPFNGTGLKTTGKNLNNSFLKNTSAIYSDGRIDYSNTDTFRCAMYDYVTLLAGTYVISTPNTGLESDCNLYDLDGTFIKKYNNEWKSFPYTIILEKASKIKVYCKKSDNSVFTASDYSVQVEFGSSASSYEPYTSSTINLPTLNYFPSGMKSAGNIYDELTESKAITRIGSGDIDGFSYGGSGSVGGLSWFDLSANSVVGSSNLATNYSLQVLTDPNDGWRSQNPCVVVNSSTNIRIYDSVSSLADFKLKYPNLEVYYELATPTDVTIDPPLDMTFDVWDDGTEQLLPENTSVPTTTPILCDIDYRTMIPVNAEDDPDGAGVITGTGNYRYHSTATLTATPTDEIYRFLRWEDENGTTVSFSSTYNFEVGE